MAGQKAAETANRSGQGRPATAAPFSSPDYSPSLHRFAEFAAACTLLLIVAGALVVGNDAGLAVPDWPLSFGTWMPPMEGGVFYEHGHRMIAASVGLLTIVLALWLWRVERRGWVCRLGWIAVAAVVFQGILGGITVLYRLPTAVVVGHACLAQAFFCLLLSIAVFTGRSWNSPLPPVEDSASPSFRQLTAWASLAIFLQLALGAALRHEALNILPHLVGAAGVCGMVGWVVLRAMRSLPEQKPLQRLAVLLGVLLIVQLALGGVSYFARLAHTARPGPGIDETMIWTTSAHVAVGALVLGTSWVLTLHSWRRLSPCRAASPFHSSPQKSPA